HNECCVTTPELPDRVMFDYPTLPLCCGAWLSPLAPPKRDISGPNYVRLGRGPVSASGGLPANSAWTTPSCRVTKAGNVILPDRMSPRSLPLSASTVTTDRHWWTWR